MLGKGDVGNWPLATVALGHSSHTDKLPSHFEDQL